MQMLDIGSVRERAAAIYTIHVSQYTPAVVHGEEDRVLVRLALALERFPAQQPAQSAALYATRAPPAVHCY